MMRIVKSAKSLKTYWQNLWRNRLRRIRNEHREQDRLARAPGHRMLRLSLFFVIVIAQLSNGNIQAARLTDQQRGTLG